jgi:hypothetical protein
MKNSLLLLFAAVVSATAQYTIDWSTIDGGGGSGSSGKFTMQSTIGQVDAFRGATGNVAFFGGYWSLFDEPLPLLRIFRFDRDIILAWPDPSPGFVLEGTPDLMVPNWNKVPIDPVSIEDEKQVNWGPPVGNYFFRLHRP